MNGFIIRNNDTGKFVTPPGSERSYTTVLQNARVFPTREQAERDKCGNETVLPLDSMFYIG